MKEFKIFFLKICLSGNFKGDRKDEKNLILDEEEEEWISGNGGRIFLTWEEEEARIVKRETRKRTVKLRFWDGWVDDA